MGDRTALQLTIYDAPQVRHQAILDIINEYGLAKDWGDSVVEPPTLEPGEWYTAEEISVGSASQIASALREAAPDATWMVWEDPKYEWLGDLYIYIPKLGLFTAECDAQGTPILSPAALLGLIDRLAGATPPADVAAVRAAVGDATGAPWFAALQQFTADRQDRDDGDADPRTVVSDPPSGPPAALPTCPGCGATELTVDYDAVVTVSLVDGRVTTVTIGGVLDALPDRLLCGGNNCPAFPDALPMPAATAHAVAAAIWEGLADYERLGLQAGITYYDPSGRYGRHPLVVRVG